MNDVSLLTTCNLALVTLLLCFIQVCPNHETGFTELGRIVVVIETDVLIIQSTTAVGIDHSTVKRANTKFSVPHHGYYTTRSLSLIKSDMPCQNT